MDIKQELSKLKKLGKIARDAQDDYGKQYEKVKDASLNILKNLEWDGTESNQFIRVEIHDIEPDYMGHTWDNFKTKIYKISKGKIYENEYSDYSIHNIYDIESFMNQLVKLNII